MMEQAWLHCPALTALLPEDGGQLVLDPAEMVDVIPRDTVILRRVRLYRLEHPGCGFLHTLGKDGMRTSTLYMPSGRLHEKVNMEDGIKGMYYAHRKDHIPRLLRFLEVVQVVSLPLSLVFHPRERELAVLDWSWGQRSVLLDAWVDPHLRTVMEKTHDKAYGACLKELERIEKAVQVLSLQYPDALIWHKDGVYWQNERILAAPGMDPVPTGLPGSQEM